MSLPFNPALKERAKALRKAGLLHEALVRNELKRKQCYRQKIIEKGVVTLTDCASCEGREDCQAQREAYWQSPVEGVPAFLAVGPPRPAGTPPREGNVNHLLSFAGWECHPVSVHFPGNEQYF